MFSSAIPMPVSLQEKYAVVSSLYTATVTLPPSSVYLMALSIRLISICLTLSGLPQISVCGAFSVQVTVMCFCSACIRSRSQISAAMVFSGNACISTLSSPDSSLLIDSISLIRRVRRSASSMIMFRNF